jgi:hypothetical protein
MNKKFLFPGILLLSLAVYFSSCNKTEEPVLDPASITFNPDSTSFTGVPGDVWTFQVTATAPHGLVNIVVDKTVGTGTPTTLQTITDTGADNTETFSFSYTLLDAEIGESVVLTFTVTETGTSGISKTKTVVTHSPAARRYTAVLLYAPTATKSAKSFFSTNTGHTYSPDSINASVDPLSADIDFGYYYGASDHASLASPAAYAALSDATLSAQVAGWGAHNDIELKSTAITSSQFAELSTMKDIDDAFAAGTTEGNSMTGLTAGQVIAFATDATKTGGSKKGLMLVKTITGTYNEGDHIELEIMVQEPAE